MSLIELKKEIYTKEEQIKLIEQQYKNKITTLNNELIELKKKYDLTTLNIDVNKFNYGKQFIFAGPSNRYNTHCSNSMVEKAIKDIVENDCSFLREEYIGMKEYAGFGPQREDHEYGYGPRHGSIIYSIGLNREYRNAKFTNEHKEAMVYYLSNLKHDK